MRRGLAGLILGLSLVVASASWAGFVMGRTVLDPGRSERLADQLLDNETLRSALVGRISDGLGAALPAEIPVPRQDLEAAADLALEDPRVEALVRDGLVRVHQNALEGNSDPVSIDASALGASARDALVGQRPELDEVLPVAPPVVVELPTSGLSWLGSVRQTVERFTLLLALTAVAGATVSLVVAKNRPAIIRRVSMWALGAAVFWLIIAYGIPLLANSVAPTSTAIVAAIIDVFFGAMISPAIAMGIVGILLFGLSFVWAGVSARRPAAMLQPATGDGPSSPAPSGPLTAAGHSTGRGLPGRQTSNVRSGTSAQPTSLAGERASRAPVPDVPQSTPVYDPTTVLSSAQPGQAQRTRTTQPQVPGTRPHSDPQSPETDLWDRTEPDSPLPNQDWVEGFGYVEDDSAG